MNFVQAFVPHPQQMRQAVKTALAAVIAYLLTTLLRLPEGQWAVISVVVVSQTHLGGSLRAGRARILGTAVGAALGVAALLVFGANTSGLTLAIGLSIGLCASLLHVHDSFRMAGLTAVIVLAGGHYDTPLLYGFTRFLEISIGVGVALAVSFLLWPARAGEALKHGVAETLRLEARYFQALAHCRFPTDCNPKNELAARDALDKSRTTNRTLLDQARNEPAGFTREEHLVVSLYNFTERIAEHLLAMEHAVHFPQIEPLHGQVFEAIEDLWTRCTVTMNALADSVDRDVPLPPLATLRLAAHNADTSFSRLRDTHVTHGFSLESVMRFMTYYFNMREVAAELVGMADRAEMLVAQTR